MLEFIDEKLKEKIKKIISLSVEIKITTAFLKYSGLDIFESISHNKVTIICGIDFFITDPSALEYLHDKAFCVRIYHELKKIFHPKCIYIKTKDKEYLIVGSSNITIGGLSNNYEVSVIIDNDFSNTEIFERFGNYFKNLFESKYCIDLNHHIFIDYKEKYIKYKNSKEDFDKEIGDKYYPNDKPVNSLQDLNRDDWIYHDTFGLGCIIEKNINDINVFF
jgi:HKD family nuclease